MARTPQPKITNEEFPQVELRGPEPLTPCLQRLWPHSPDVQLPRSAAVGLVRE
jgi:hypothetical protein